MLSIKDVEMKQLEVQKLFDELKSELSNSLNNIDAPSGVKYLNNNMCMVSSSALFASKHWNPNSFLMNKQADAVMGVLEKCESVKSFKSKILDMINVGKIMYKGDTVYLDDLVLDELKKFVN